MSSNQIRRLLHKAKARGRRAEAFAEIGQVVGG